MKNFFLKISKYECCNFCENIEKEDGQDNPKLQKKLKWK